MRLRLRLRLSRGVEERTGIPLATNPERGGAMFEVNISARSIEPFTPIVGGERVAAVHRLAAETRERIGNHEIINISAADRGGGVAESLAAPLRYARGLGITGRWFVLEGPAEFNRIVDDLHGLLQGRDTDDSELGPRAAALFETVALENAVALNAIARAGDLVICHDPASAGLIPLLGRRGLRAVWRCHIGTDAVNRNVEYAWRFLRPYVEMAAHTVFTRPAYVPPWLPDERVSTLPPTIDPFSAKNQFLDDATTRAILIDVGIVTGERGDAPATFVRDDGSIGRVDRRVELTCLGPEPTWETPLILQVSRWDEVKDHLGVMESFARFLAPEVPREAHLVLAGPELQPSDEAGRRVLEVLRSAWHRLPESTRHMVHVVELPITSRDENATIVNALQRHATVIVQKSLCEAFGLPVTEAMWKARPVVASAVGGIRDQIEDGISGLLLQEPRDLVECAGALRRILTDDALAMRLGMAAHNRVRDHYMSLASVERWGGIIRRLCSPMANVSTAVAH